MLKNTKTNTTQAKKFIAFIRVYNTLFKVTINGKSINDVEKYLDSKINAKEYQIINIVRAK